MSNLEMIVIVLAAAAGSMVHGSVGIGLTLVAGPLLVAIDPSFAPGPLLVAGQLVGARNIISDWDNVNRTACARCMTGLPFGIAAGLLVLTLVSKQTMSILVGAFTAAAALALLAGFTLRRSRQSEIVGGAVTAFSSITAGLPGPPLVVTFHDMKAPELRGTAGVYIMSVAAVAFVALLITGNFGSHEFALLLWLLPGVLLGLVLSHWLRPYLNNPWFRPLVLVMALIGGLGLVAKQLL